MVFPRNRLPNLGKSHTLSTMIGPHQGKELELMLAGKKHLAVFSDVPVDGKIPEHIIPEESFRSYVDQGRIKRFAKEYSHQGKIIRYVCYTLPDHEWRAAAFFWIHEEGMEKRRPFDEAYEFFIGRLLDYEESDIRDFIERQKEKIPPRTGT